MLEYLKEQQADIYNELFVENCYDVNEEKVRGKVVIDLGANRGYFALLCNELGAKEIICVEAQKDMCEGLLKKNTKHLSNVKILNYAVTDKSGDIVNLSNDDWGSSLYVNKDKKGVGADVETISLADLIKDHSETDMVLKLDIEGAEYDVLLNANEELLKRFSIIGVEIHGNIHPKYKGSDIIENKLNSFGFRRTKVLEMCNIYTDNEGKKTYVPMGYRTCSFIRTTEKDSFVLIAPFAQKLRNGEVNSKNYSYWRELIELIGKDKIIQIGVKGEEQLVPDMRLNLPLAEIKTLLHNCNFWISVDSFLQHLADYTKKKGVVLFGSSNPNIFGYPNNINILKDKSYLRPNQFGIWEEEKYNPERFLKASEVYKIIKDNFDI
jgi:FkbM family methyltransferase